MATRRQAKLAPLAESLFGRSIVAIVLLVVVAIALWPRVYELGEAPLAEDEYYQVRSVEFILETGLPEFPSGGYYTRSPILQYLMAGSALVFGQDEASYRLPALIFSLLAVALAYVYTRRFAGPAMASAVAIALLVSSWHVEFARFARMYTLFQCTTLAFLILVDRAFFSNHWRERYLPHVMTLVNMLAHALAVLLSPLLLLPVILDRTRAPFRSIWHRMGFAVVGLGTMGLCYAFLTSGGRSAGVSDRWPAGYEPVGGGDESLVVPAFPFWGGGSEPLLVLAIAIALAAATAGFLLLLQHRGYRVTPVDTFLAALVVFSAFHLFVLCLVIVVVLVLRYRVYRPSLHPPRVYALLLLCAVIGAGWLTFALLEPAMLRVPAVTSRWDMAEAGFLKSMWSTFFGWPDMYRGTLRPFITEAPWIGLLGAGALAWTLIAHRDATWRSLLRHPAFIIVLTIATYGVLEAPWSRLRYWFHLYPVILCLIALAMAEIARRLVTSSPARADALAVLGFLGAFALTSDFNPMHLWRAGDAAVAFRTGPFEPFETVWYPRFDVVSPADFVEQAAGSGEETAIIVENLPPASYYLNREHAIYYIRGSARFDLVSRERGTREIWSDMRLLSTPDEMVEYTRRARDVWLIRETRRFHLLPEPPEVWGERLLEQSQAHLSRDGRVEVLHIELAPPRGAAPAASEAPAGSP